MPLHIKSKYIKKKTCDIKVNTQVCLKWAMAYEYASIISLRWYSVLTLKALKSRFQAQIFLYCIANKVKNYYKNRIHTENIFLIPQNQKKSKVIQKNCYATRQTKNDIRFLHLFFPSCLFIKSLQLCGVLFKSERKDDRRLLLLAGSCNPFSHFPRLTLIAQGTSWEWRNEATVFLQQTLKSSNSADFQISF